MNTPSSAHETADRILHVAEQLFAQHGYDGVSISAVAQHAGVSKANVFHHFQSKEALYQAVLQRAGHASQELVDDLADNGQPLYEQLARFTRNQIHALYANADLTRLIQREMLEHGQRRGPELGERIYGPHFARLVDHLQAAQQRGEMRSGIDPALVAVMLIAGNVFHHHNADLLRHLPGVDFADDPERFARQACDILLHGIVQPPPEAREP